MYKCLGMDPPAPSSLENKNLSAAAVNGGGGGEAVVGAHGASMREDENSSYASLIHNIERGL